MAKEFSDVAPITVLFLRNLDGTCERWYCCGDTIRVGDSGKIPRRRRTDRRFKDILIQRNLLNRCSRKEFNMLTLEKFEEAAEAVREVTLNTRLIYSDFLSGADRNKVI
jgi:hypothetical protein